MPTALTAMPRAAQSLSARHKAALACVAIATALALSAARPASTPCDHVVSYFTDKHYGSQSNGYEWRIYDPSRKTDELFLSLPNPINGFQGVRWDSTLAHAWFASGDSLYRVQWKRGARARLITKLPTDFWHWWFNPDSGCWQGLRLLGEGPDSPDYERYGGELWQSTRDGTAWRLVRADSVDLVDSDNDHWRWSDGAELGREQPVVTLNDLASEAWDESWEGKTAFIDTSTITVTRDDGNDYDYDQWLYFSLSTSPRRGIAFRHGEPGAPEHNWHGVNGPFYFVDLDRRSKTLIDGTDAYAMRSLVAEHCGFALVPGVMGNARIIDSSGRRVFSNLSSTDAVWVPRPKP